MVANSVGVQCLAPLRLIFINYGRGYMSTITVASKVLGRSKPLFTDWHVPLPPSISDGGEVFTLRILLTQIVLSEVEAFQTRQEQRRLINILTKAEIEQRPQNSRSYL